MSEDKDNWLEREKKARTKKHAWLGGICLLMIFGAGWLYSEIRETAREDVIKAHPQEIKLARQIFGLEAAAWSRHLYKGQDFSAQTPCSVYNRFVVSKDMVKSFHEDHLFWEVIGVYREVAWEHTRELGLNAAKILMQQIHGGSDRTLTKCMDWREEVEKDFASVPVLAKTAGEILEEIGVRPEEAQIDINAIRNALLHDFRVKLRSQVQRTEWDHESQKQATVLRDTLNVRIAEQALDWGFSPGELGLTENDLLSLKKRMR